MPEAVSPHAPTAPSAADTPAGHDPAMRAAIYRLLQESRSLQHAHQMHEAAVRYVMQGMQAVPVAQADRVQRALMDEADQVFAEHLPAFAESMVPLYEQHFSLREIEQMIAFHSSPLGRKLLEVMPVIMQQSAVLIEDWARSLMPTFYRRARSRLRAEGVQFDSDDDTPAMV